MKNFIKQYVLYLIRWQLSSPILAMCLVYLNFGVTLNTIIANIIGGLIFFWVDRFIFTSKLINPLWEIENDVICVDCGSRCKGFRIVRAKNYDRSKDKYPQWRCEECSIIKENKLREEGKV